MATKKRAAKKAAIRGGSLRKWLQTSKKQRSKIRATYEPKTVFLIMAFEGTDRAYAAIKDECQKLRLKATRADENTDSGLIIQDIFDDIEGAEFIICDVTNGRPNVYYELGYAHGVGNTPENILLLAEKGTVLQFDIAAFRVRHYASTKELRSIVSARLIEWKAISKSQKPVLPRASKKR